MKYFKFSAACVFLFVSHVSLVHAGTEEYCANKWPDDFQMRDYCQNQQIEAKQELFSIAKSKGLIKEGSLSASSTGDDHEKIINRCMRKWENSRFKTYDFNMVVYCIKQQFEAYDRLK